MTDKIYVKKMIALIDELYHHSAAELFDPVGFHDLCVRFRATHSIQLQRRRRRSWFMALFLFVLFCIVALIVFLIIC